jgi:hypothetical protein
MFRTKEAFDILFFGQKESFIFSLRRSRRHLFFGQKKRLALHFSTRKSWSCRWFIFRIKAHSTSHFSGRTFQHFEEAVDSLVLGQKKLSIFYFRTKKAFHILLIFGQKTLSIFWGRFDIFIFRTEEAIGILFLGQKKYSEFYFSARISHRYFIFRTEQAVHIMCFQIFILYWINGAIRRHFGKQMTNETKLRIHNITAKAA